jgi:nucleolar protein 56
MEHLLFEHPKGYALFELKDHEDLSKGPYEEYMRLTQVLNFTSSFIFETMKIAAGHLECIARGELHEDLKNFLELHKVRILHCDGSLKDGLELIGIKQRSSGNIMRGVRKNIDKLARTSSSDRRQMVLGLSYAYSRNKIEYNIKREDSIVIHTVLLLEQVDRDINSYTMRVKEIYGWMFPELASIAGDSYEYICMAKHLLTGDASVLPEEKIRELREAKSKTIGMELSEPDVLNIKSLLRVIEEKTEIRKNLAEYLREKMSMVAPNLSAILGDTLSAKLISQAGGLFNLGKAPASTIQVLGAEKSLFKALKMRSNTPKHGVLYSAKFLSTVRDREKGRLCRFIATKCSIAARIDCFRESRDPEYGLELRRLIESKIRALRTKEEVERSDSVLKRVYEKIKRIKEGQDANEASKPKDELELKKTGESKRKKVNKIKKINESEGRKSAKKVKFDLSRNSISRASGNKK